MYEFATLSLVNILKVMCPVKQKGLFLIIFLLFVNFGNYVDV